MTALLVASGGGHLKQLHRLLPRLEVGPDRIWITFDTALSRSLLADEDVRFAPYARPHDFLGTVRDAAFAARFFRRERINRAISTGANLAVAFLPMARLLGARTEYIESATRSDGPSLSGRMLQKVPGINLYTQHQALAHGRWRFAGSVFDGFASEPLPAIPPVRNLVVVLGANDSYPFPRLIQRLQEIIPAHVEVLWQVGSTKTDIAGAREKIPVDELETAMHEADAVIAHAGTGAALSAMESGRFPILVPRRSAHGEHVDDHQTQTAFNLQARGLALSAEASELTWHDVSVAASWQVIENLATPPARPRRLTSTFDYGEMMHHLAIDRDSRFDSSRAGRQKTQALL